MNPRIATVCRYYPGNDYQLATGTVVTANAHGREYMRRKRAEGRAS